MSLKHRVARLERNAAKVCACPVCHNRLPEVVEVHYGEESPQPRPCPGCGRERGQVVILLFGKRENQLGPA